MKRASIKWIISLAVSGTMLMGLFILMASTPEYNDTTGDRNYPYLPMMVFIVSILFAISLSGCAISLINTRRR